MRDDSPKNRLSGWQGNRGFRNSLFFIKRVFSEGLVLNGGRTKLTILYI